MYIFEVEEGLEIIFHHPTLQYIFVCFMFKKMRTNYYR